MFDDLSCSVVRDLLPQYAEGLLSAESEKEVRRHLEHCKSCQQVYREMTDPEPQLVETIPEVDYLKKVRRSRLRFLAGALAAAALVAVGAWFLFRDRAEQSAREAEAAAQLEVEAAQENANAAREDAEAAREEAEAARRDAVNYDEESQTIVIFGKSADVNVEIPAELAEQAKNLDAQYESFHLSILLSLLQNGGELSAKELYEDYVNRTNLSLRFLRSYLKEHAGDESIAAQAEKFVELTVRWNYGYANDPDRIRVELGSYYWHREEQYLLALMDTKTVEWQQLGYVWYLGCILNPYCDVYQGETELPEEYRVTAPYERAKGDRSFKAPEDVSLFYDAISWVCLNDGMYWGTSYESAPIRTTRFYSGDKGSGGGNQKLSVSMAASFVGWLSEQYGFDRVTAFCFNKMSMEDALGVDFDTAFAAWAAWIQERCG